MYLASLKPLLSAEDYSASERNVKEFIKDGGFGHELQKRLMDYDKTQKNSWLEAFWLKYAYLIWRCPTMINVNWWCQFVDHPSYVLPKVPPKGQFTDHQIRRASVMISNLLNINDSVNYQTLPAEYAKTTPLDMNQYRCQFQVARIPEVGCDKLVTTWPTTSKHIIVLLRDQVYKVDVMGPKGERVSIAEIERQLRSAVTDVSNTTPQPAVGLLTSEDRDVWAKARASLSKLSKTNQQSFDVIDSALFAVSLDDYTSSHDIDVSHHQLFHNFDARNRWFDKSISMIVMNSGRAGVNGEHSPADAVIPGNMFDYALNKYAHLFSAMPIHHGTSHMYSACLFTQIISEEPARDPPNAKQNVQLSKPQKLQWHVNEDLLKTITKAEENAKKLISNVESVLLHTNEFGGNWIKASAKASPDSFIQMAMQLAYYRDQQKVCATYESASTRQFLHGRTETVRSCSEQSKKFVEAWDKKDVSRQEKLSLLAAAIKTHYTTMVAASTGQACDRHLLGLRLLMDPSEASKAPIFTDPAYSLSQTFKLSSSNMSPGKTLYGGFGAVTENGYGVNYAIGKENLKFSMSSYRSSEETDSKRFRENLVSSLRDLKKAIDG
ncbi:acyltransferase ChoActase/COT/CPT [Paraphysoderma sedebokerense]|nr:acyltransferase ChoActase/COT/CPT [Paraphysoderma sedebokerense]